jgi:hypothetical protein
LVALCRLARRRQAREALVVPATDEGVHWSTDALDRVGELTMGFPYFVQEFGKQAIP